MLYCGGFSSEKLFDMLFRAIWVAVVYKLKSDAIVNQNG